MGFEKDRLPDATFYYSQHVEKFKVGRNQKAIGACPFHGDEHPSLSMNLATGSFRCYACPAKGSDVLAFHQMRYHLGFKDAACDLGAWS